MPRAKLGDTRPTPLLDHLAVLGGRVDVAADVGDGLFDELVALVAERAARARVDRRVPHILVRDEHEPRAVVDGLAQQARLDQGFRETHGDNPPVTDLLEFFAELAAIPSPSGSERRVADLVTTWLRGRGLDVVEDDAAAALGGDAGNLYCRLEPTAEGEPLFFCAHLDTVPPEGPIEPEAGEDGFVRNAAGTILGADNKAAVVSMLAAVERLLEERRPHAGVELVLTPMEEIGLRGAEAFDSTRLRARTGYVYDQAAPIGEIVLGAPYAAAIEARFHGRAAHAGMYPEEGRSAIAAAARAIADLRLGRVDEESTANVGVVSGGTARNIVPEWCEVRAEARSHDERKLADLVQEMVDAFAFGANACDCEVETQVQRSYRGYRFAKSDRVVRLAVEALERCGAPVSYALSGGAADANVFNERGLACVNLANGMTDIHTPAERIAVADLERMADVTLALCDAALA